MLAAREARQLDPLMVNKHKDDAWAEAKRLCRLSADDIAKAKALGMSPRSLIKNIPSRSQQWKAPVRDWVRDLYEERFGNRPVRTPPIAKPAPTAKRAPARAPMSDELPGDELDVDEDIPADQGVTEADRDVLRKRKNWIKAARYVAWEFRKLPWVNRVALFGSLAGAPTDPPSSGKPKLWPGATLHDPKDIDLAIWVTDLSDLRALQKARVRGLQRLLEKASIGVAHHQVDVCLLEPGTDRYLGRLCDFKTRLVVVTDGPHQHRPAHLVRGGRRCVAYGFDRPPPQVEVARTCTAQP